MARTTGRPATGTLTLTLEVPIPSASSSASSSTQQSQPPQALVLRLKRPKKKVSWKEGTVDNEFLNRNSSKKCCIFHKQKPFDEDGSDDEDRARPSGDIGDPTPLHGETSGPSYCCAHSDH